MSKPLLIARTLDTELFLLPGMANRHGLITGATGTGKTVTLQKLAESLSEIGVPVFMADVKGDLTGVAAEGTASEKLLARLKNIGVNDWLSGGEFPIDIRRPHCTDNKLSIGVKDIGTMKTIFIIIIPAILLLIGVGIWFFRRRN